MAKKNHGKIQRRDFLKLAGTAAAAAASGTAYAAAGRKVRILTDSSNPLLDSPPVAWAIGKLRELILAKGVTCDVVHTIQRAQGSTEVILLAANTSSLAESLSKPTTSLEAPESLRLIPMRLSGAPGIWIEAADQAGLIYGLLELAERVQFSNDASLGLSLRETEEHATPNPVRSAMRAFCSEVEDKPWYYDEEFWRGYLDALAFSRFNRFNFAYGFGYDFPRGVTGDYFHFPYPYLVDVPGYDVRVQPALAPGEKARNLQMLRFIASETAARGIQFQLGIWTHAYEWTDSPHSDHHIIGLTAATHANYCRDALAIILKDCPQIQGLTLRVHGESGIPEGSYPFWKTLFEAISGAGRKIEIDMHAKGINQIMIDMATATGMPVKVGAKYSAEHMGLGYQQADIRELEIPRADRMESGVFNVSNGDRRFTRYGYADLFQQGRKYDVLFRLWPGTQRHLLSGDPELVAAYARTAHFCGASGLEFCEPLTFKGREGSGLTGGRCAYADASLSPGKGDWKKFEYTYRLWGRLLYDPETKPEVWQRYLRSEFGPAADSMEVALANASRILPLVTSAHLPSAANHSYWPEIYANMPIVLGSESSPYSDTPDPKRFGTVSPLDPQLFSSVIEHAQNILASKPSPKYSPMEVAQWLDGFSTAASDALSLARSRVASQASPDFRRAEEDILIQIGLGRFFAAKLRSAVLFEVCQQTGNSEAGQAALAQYTQARSTWAVMAKRASGVYRTDITYGEIPSRRGHWSDRLPAIDIDLSAMRSKVADTPVATPGASKAATFHPATILARVNRPNSQCSHTAPETFHPGRSVSLVLQMSSTAPAAVDLHYRHVNQGERWRSTSMTLKELVFQGEIPASYTDSPFPLQYYFQLIGSAKAAWFYPAFNPALSNQPYYVISKRLS